MRDGSRMDARMAANETEVRRPVLRYHGGKWKLAPWIISHFPPHRIYVEPFAGAASVLLRKPRSYAEIYNDRWGLVVNVFRVLRDHGDELANLLALTPFSRDDFDLCSETSDDPVEQARRTIYRSMAGFASAAVNGKYSTGFRGTSARAGTTPAQDWMHYPAHVTSFVERLRGVTIENRDAAQCMIQHDSDQTLHYVDPPYVHETRNMLRRNPAYEVEMSDEDHRELAQVLIDLEGMVILSGYRCDLYDTLYSDWVRVDRATKADGARDRIESLWLNPQAQVYGQTRLFEGDTER